MGLLKTFKAPTEREHEDTLLRATEQLHISKYDVQLFVLKNLAAITSSDKVNQESAQIMSRLLLKNTSDFTESIIPLLIKIVSTCKCPHNSCIALRCLIL